MVLYNKANFKHREAISLNLLQKLLKRQEEPRSLCSAVIVAAGRASRMGGIDKILCPMANEPLLLHTLRPFQASEAVDEIVIVTSEERMVEVGALCSNHGITKVKRIVKGGATRTESVQAGLKETDKAAGIIAIHDGARPFVTMDIIETAIRTARERGAAAPAIPVKDTIKRAVDGVITETPDRSQLFAVQTPQVFDADLIKGAIAKAIADKAVLTDDCSAVERLGFPVCLTEGSEENIKITTPADLLHGEAILEGRETL